MLCAIQREPKLGVAEFGKYDWAGKGIGVGRADEIALSLACLASSHVPSRLQLSVLHIFASQRRLKCPYRLNTHLV